MRSKQWNPPNIAVFRLNGSAGHLIGTSLDEPRVIIGESARSEMFGQGVSEYQEVALTGAHFQRAAWCGCSVDVVLALGKLLVPVE